MLPLSLRMSAGMVFSSTALSQLGPARDLALVRDYSSTETAQVPTYSQISILKMIHSNDNKAHDAAFSDPSLGVVLTKFLRQLKYQTPAHASHDGTRPAVEAAMLEYAAGSGVSYEPERARSMFDAGLDIACVRLFLLSP